MQKKFHIKLPQLKRKIYLSRPIDGAKNDKKLTIIGESEANKSTQNTGGLKLVDGAYRIVSIAAILVE